MSHRRNPSEGLNIGADFPTTYSTFAVNADSRADGSSRSTASQTKRASTHLKRRTSPPLDSLLKQEGSLKTYSSSAAQASSSPSITFESTSVSPVSTQKSWETTVQGFYKRWKFVVFFLAFSALVVCGTLLPVSRSKAALKKPASTIKRDNILHKHVRSVRDAPPVPQAEQQAVANRFSRWAQTILGSERDAAQVVHPVPVPAGLGDLEMPDDIVMAADPDPDIVMMAEKAMAERRAAKWAARWSKNKKRRTTEEGDDELDKGAHEHPSRVARRQKLAATQKVDADEEARRRKLADKRVAKNGVFERIARVFQASASAAAASVEGQNVQGSKSNWKTGSAESQHILDTWGASHPELIDLDGGYAGF